MNWEIFTGIVQHYIDNGDFDMALDFEKRWNIIGKETKLEDVSWILDYDNGIYFESMEG
jgi:hypothetical protein